MRLTILMIEVEQPEGVSSRKLVLEAARHNVLTAYSGKCGLEILNRFPNVDVVVVHTEMQGLSFQETVRELKRTRPDLPVIGISPAADREQDGADYMLSSYDPQDLLELLAERFEASGEPS